MNKAAVQIVLSGNAPKPADFKFFPPYIYFDGRPNVQYDNLALSRIGFISDDLRNYTFSGAPYSTQDSIKLANIVQKVNAQGKLFRFWDTPDNKATWDFFYHLSPMGMILVNTDHPDSCSAYLQKYH